MQPHQHTLVYSKRCLTNFFLLQLAYSSQLVIVSDPSKPFSYTAKGAPRRAAILSDYDVDIEALYNEVGKSSQISPPDRWSAESSLIFVRAAVNEVLRRPAADHDDIFERGCDRLAFIPFPCMLQLKCLGTQVYKLIGSGRPFCVE